MTTPATDPPPPVPLRWENVAVLWAFVRPHLRTVVLGTALGLGSTATTLAMPLATKWVLDTLGTDASLTGPVVLLVALLAVGSVTGLVQWVVLGRLAEHIVLDARLALVRRLLLGRLGDVQQRSTGELVTRVTSDTVLLREAASQSVVQLVNGLVQLVGTVVLMAVLDVPLLLSTLLAIVVVAVLMAVLLPRIGVAQRQAQESLGQVGSALEGTLRALRTVKASGAEDRQAGRIAHQAQESARHGVRAVQVTAVAWTVAGGGIQLAVIAILGVGAWRVGQGTLAVSTLVAFLLYAFTIVGPITTLTQTFTQLQSGVAAAARIRETEGIRTEDLHGTPGHAGDPADDDGDQHGNRHEDPQEARQVDRLPVHRADHRAERADHPGGDPLAPETAQDAVLTLEGVRLTYPGATAPALDGVDLAVPRRGHTALVGPSGAGKTSVLSLLLRFVAPDSGTLRLDGVPYDRLSIRAVRSRFAYVEQETLLLTGTVRDNVVFRYPEATDEEVWDALRAVRLDGTVRALPEGLDTPVMATDLSGGERQRVALARAVVRRPEVLLLDEATAQLDGLTEAAVQDVIHSVARDGAVLTIAHRLSTVVDADQIVVLEAGRVRARGTHAELLATDDLYRELVAALRIAETEPSQDLVG